MPETYLEPQCHGTKVENMAGDFDKAQSNGVQRSCYGEGDIAIGSQHTFKSFQNYNGAEKIAEKRAEKKVASIRRPCKRDRDGPFEHLWAVTDNALKFVPPEKSKIENIKRIFNVYTKLPLPALSAPKKTSIPSRTLKSSSYINRMTVLKETQRTNNIVVKKILNVKSTIESKTRFVITKNHRSYTDRLVFCAHRTVIDRS